ncbi:MAG: phosphate acetyltransferase [Nitriliruptoraceae bacterium]|nr:phosphate acetyltransferase [Nitriliruptoraceae bacterium]
MADRLFLASLEPRAGRSLVTLGLMELLTRRLGSVGYVRPIVANADRPDARIELVRRRYGLEAEATELALMGSDEVAEAMATGHTDDVFATILDRARRLEQRFDAVLYDGTDYTGTAAALEFEVNARIATDLGAPVIALVNGADRLPEDTIDALRLARESLLGEGCSIAAIIVNRVPERFLADVVARIDDQGFDEPVWALPEVPLLRMPTVREIVDELDADEVAGEEADLDREVTSLRIAAMSLPNMLSHIDEGSLLIAPSDRPDVIVGALVSRMATNFPNLAALVLTGGFPLHDNVIKLLDGLIGAQVPILAVSTDTFTTAQRIAAVPAVIRASSTRKIETALGIFESHVDLDALEQRIQVSRTERVTPLMFGYDLLQRARADRKRIVLPEGEDERILRATEVLLRRDVVDLTLLGDPDRVRAAADSFGVELGDVTIIDPATDPLRSRFAASYHELRAHKGISEEFAFDTLADVSYFGTMMVHEGVADGMVSGAAHTTQHTIRPSFEVIRTAPGVSVVSSVFLMCLADRVLVYGDCAVNPEPDATQLADIAISSADTAAAFGIDPRVAMLSYSTGESGKGQAVEKVREATALVHERRPELEVDGPIQYDAAVDVSVGAAKMPGSNVAGRATVFIFPDLNTGNNTYKAVQRSSGAVAIGPVLQGLNKPVNDLSRGCLVEDVVNTVVITAIQAQQVAERAEAASEAASETHAALGSEASS